MSLIGVGSLLDIGALTKGGTPLLIAALLVLIVVVVALNELLWKPLYRRAAERYRIE